MWPDFCSFPGNIDEDVVYKGPGLSERGLAMPSNETSSLPRRALELPVVAMLTFICHPFSRMGIYTCLGLEPFRCHQNCTRTRGSTTSEALLASCRSVSWSRLRNHPWIIFIFSKMLHYISLFPAPFASPSGFYGAHLGLLTLSSE